MTLRELKKLVDFPKKGEKIPTFQRLQVEKNSVVVEKTIQTTTDLAKITVYQNGYITYQILNKATVFHIEEVNHYQYTSVSESVSGSNLDKEFFEDAEWYLGFVLYGEDRLNRNLKDRDQRKCISLNSAMEQMKLAEDKTQNIEEMLISQITMESMFSVLTDVQKKIVKALYIEHLTYQECATDYGISSAAVNNIRKQAIKKLLIYVEKNRLEKIF